MIPAIVVFIYLAVVVYIGIFVPEGQGWAKTTFWRAGRSGNTRSCSRSSART